ncbi:hypothetical protein [uncultured Corynebacterium sp.]|uniref:hypothetical protein n=1 Tax=uncultured Corynebacterium sp. TaxID=159447 RepID=UPI0025FC2C1C|nr:hypothetical protein [uncultured Corynebacterium sp.]
MTIQNHPMTTGAKKRAFLTGAGSLMDLSGKTTYRRAQKMMPPPKKPMTYGQLEQMIRRLEVGKGT